MLTLLSTVPEVKEACGLSFNELMPILSLSFSGVRAAIEKPTTQTIKAVVHKLNAPDVGRNACYKCDGGFLKIPAPKVIENSLTAHFAMLGKELFDIADMQKGASHRFYGGQVGEKEKAFLVEWLEQTAEFVFSWENLCTLLVKREIFTVDQINSIIFAKLQNHITKEETTVATAESM